MSDSEIVEAQALPYVKQIFLLLLLVTLILMVYYVPTSAPVRAWIAYTLPFFLGYFLRLIIAIYRTAIAPLPILPFLAGLIFTIGGPAFDVIVTIILNPSLNIEANPIARTFLDSGHPVWFVYLYGFIAQSLSMLLTSMLWATFLRHRITLIDLAWQSHPQNAKEFIYAAFHGVPKADWSFGLRLSDYRQYKWYRTAQWAFYSFAVANVGRYNFGLKWLGLGFPRNSIIVTIVVLMIFPYFIWLYMQFIKGHRA